MNYVDGFVLPIPRKYLEEYKAVATQVAEVWKEYGALAYYECVGDDLKLEGVRSFVDATNASEEEIIIFGWTVFENKEQRDIANAKVPHDSRMGDLVGPLTDPNRLIFDASRMVFGGFNQIV